MTNPLENPLLRVLASILAVAIHVAIGWAVWTFYLHQFGFDIWLPIFVIVAISLAAWLYGAANGGFEGGRLDRFLESSSSAIRIQLGTWF